MPCLPSANLTTIHAATRTFTLDELEKEYQHQYNASRLNHFQVRHRIRLFAFFFFRAGKQSCAGAPLTLPVLDRSTRSLRLNSLGLWCFLSVVALDGRARARVAEQNPVPASSAIVGARQAGARAAEHAVHAVLVLPVRPSARLVGAAEKNSPNGATTKKGFRVEISSSFFV